MDDDNDDDKEDDDDDVRARYLKQVLHLVIVDRN